MATVLYRNARVLVDGYEFTSSFTELAVEYSAELLDNTVFGADTRTRKGGLFNAKVSGKGFAEFAANLAAYVLWGNVGTDDVVFSLYPDGITEGATGSGTGYAMKGTIDKFDLGGKVGQLLEFTLSVASRGIAA